MELVYNTFKDRLAEIEVYFELVSKIEDSVGDQTAYLGKGEDKYQIKPDQQRIMQACVYLLLYNLVESTVSTLIEAVERHAIAGINKDLKSLSIEMRKIYVKSVTRPQEDLNYEKRLDAALDLFEQALDIKPISLTIPPGGGGNWDQTEIKRFSKSIGVNIKLPKSINARVCKPFKDEKGPIRLVKELRNKLAHGSISFKECGDGVLSSDLRELIDIVKDYLSRVIAEYDKFLNERRYKAI